MPERGLHCPFLNRADERCSTHFSLDHLGQAFTDCFDQYHACPTYQELLLERQVRRAEAAFLRPLGGPGERPLPDGSFPHPRGHVPFVPLTVASRSAPPASPGGM